MSSWPYTLAFADGGGGPVASILSFAPFIIVFVIFYLLVFAPMRKRQKALQTLLDNIKKGDKVVTNGGLFGEVAAIEGNVVHLKVADGVRLRISKSAIAGLESPEGSAS
jgi:preprotein translocase subunit YajC